MCGQNHWAKCGVLSVIALVVVIALDVRAKQGESDGGLRVLSLILLILLGVRWASAFLVPMAKGWISLLTGGPTFDTNIAWRVGGLVGFVVASSLTWCVQRWSEESRGGVAPDPDSSRSRKDKSRSARRQFEEKKTRGLNKKASKKRKSKACAHVPESRNIAANKQVEYDSGYLSSGDDEPELANIVVGKNEPIMSLHLGQMQQTVSDCCVCLEEGAVSCAIMPCRHLCLCASRGRHGVKLNHVGRH
jgi:hypothetical protein